MTSSLSFVQASSVATYTVVSVFLAIAEHAAWHRRGERRERTH